VRFNSHQRIGCSRQASRPQQSQQPVRSVGDSPGGPLKELGNPQLKPATSQSQTRLA
jgi:hypothetical protein